MASRESKSPSTPSEGEIIESGSDAKAPTSQTSLNDTHINHRDTRPDTRASSRSSEQAGRSFRRERSRSSRSRSPYRRPRGEKRRHDDGYGYDRDSQMTYSRRGGSRYDDRRHRGRDDFDRRRRPYYDYDRSDRYEDVLRYNDDYDSRSGKRPRTRSRSPFREVRNQRRYPDERDHDGRPSDSDRARPGDKGSYTKQSVSERGEPSVVAQSSKQEAEQPKNQVQEAPSAAGSGGATNAVGPDINVEEPGSTEPIDEAALIEQRRKRREAIKAKYRNQASPLPPQTSKPDGESVSAATGAEKSVALDNPRGSAGNSALNTPDATSGVQSPADFKVTKDEDLVDADVRMTGEAEQEGPSAVDYDPTKDMREDKMKHDKRHFADEVSAGAYDETIPAKHELLVPDPTSKQPGHMKVKDPFDMFAEDDDDMFAEDPPVSSKTNNQDTEAGKPSMAQPQELDMSMMDNWDDPEGYYNVMLGELVNGRYHVQQNLGKGMFSSVVRATDSKTGKLVAVKIIRNNDTMRKAGIKEIEILEKLCTTDPDDKKHMIRFERQFDHKGHLCMVFENLSMNLREVLKKFGRDVGLNLRAIRAYAQQMFLGLSLLRKCSILHADLKPDNLLVNESRNLLKMCDLGSASPASESEITPYLVSRFYRAPEIMLGIPYDYAIDVWSIGCTLFELYTGKILFTGRNNNQMLRSIMECRGKFPPKFLRRGMLTHLHFDDMLNFRSLEEDKVTGRMVTKILDLRKPTRDLKTRLMGKGQRLSDSEAKEVALFIDLLERCLSLNPEKRCTPSEALKHPFIARSKT